MHVQNRAIVNRGAVLLKDLMLLNQQSFTKMKVKFQYTAVKVHGGNGGRYSCTHS